ncbi:MAG: tetratricopeptide repeat protein [Helicobacter sp.]|nr:tetratricopeptide repeat protein [Helicobacter sp.]
MFEKLKNKLKQTINKLRQNPAFDDVKVILRPYFYKTKGLLQIKHLLKIIIGILVLLVLLIILLVILIPDNVSEPEQIATKKDEIKKVVQKKIGSSELDSLLQKANIFYRAHNRPEALSVFKEIALFSQGLANYNLGILELKNKDYKNALNSFNNAIKNNQNVSLNTFNAAIAARKMGDNNLATLLLQKAASNLSEDINEPFFPYLYSLVNFYNGNYFASLAGSASDQNSAFDQNKLEVDAKSFLVFNDNINAINALEKSVESSKDYKTLGLLYARISNFDRAKLYLSKYQNKNPKDLSVLMPLALLYLKTRDFNNAQNILNAISLQEDKVKEIIAQYPIKVVLQQRLFDIDIAQSNFMKNGIKSNFFLPDKIIFHYAPFKVFNPNEVAKTLKNANIFIDNFITGTTFLEGIRQSSSIDLDITNALLKIYNKDLSGGLSILQNTAASNPNDPILHYNLGLVYAKMNDFQNAYNHFLRAYYLDVKDMDSGIFALIASKFLSNDTGGLKSDMLENLNITTDGKDSHKKFALSFWDYANGTFDQMNWLNESKNNLPIYYALQIAHQIQSDEKDFTKLNSALQNLYNFDKHDIVTLILREIFKENSRDFRGAANRLYSVFSKSQDIDGVLYGGALERELYTYVGFITGTLTFQEKEVKTKLTASNKNIAGILQVLALINIYQHKFEEAYAIYDVLINTLKVTDSQTQFLSALASIGSGNYDHAALLLQLSKMEGDSSFETRLILGMLYQQNGNLKAASSHYKSLIGKNFGESFFDFIIDNQKFLEYQKANK